MQEALLKTLADGAAEIGVRLDRQQLELFAAYHRELLLWNRRVNLVSERSSREIVIRHFLDSLTPAPWISCPEGLLIDIGSGAGFPGIPLRIAFPGLRLMLVEASRKKTSFLSHIVRSLKLDQVTVVRERVEVLIGEQACAGRFDTVLSRAAFKLPELIRMASFFLAPGGILIAMKGPDPQKELEEAELISAALGLVRTVRRDAFGHEAVSSRKIVCYERVSLR